jgi:hypothetical protein
MIDFVTTIKQHANEYVADLKRIQRRVQAPPAHQPAKVHKIPDDYKTFKPSKK